MALSMRLRWGFMVAACSGKNERVVVHAVHDVDGSNTGAELAVQRLDELVRDDGVAGVGGMHAVEREEAAEEIGGEHAISHGETLPGGTVQEPVNVHDRRADFRCRGLD